MDRTYLTTQSTEDIIGDSFQSLLERFSAAPATAGPAPAERESSDDDAGTVDLETPMSKRYLPRDPVKFYIGTPVDERFRRERPEEFFIGTPVPGRPGTPPQTGKRDSDEISGVAVASVLERTMSDGEISGVAGRAVLGRPNPDENLGWERSVYRPCGSKCVSVEGETPFSRNETLLMRDAVEFFARTPAGDEVITDRSEEFFILPGILRLRLGPH